MPRTWSVRSLFTLFATGPDAGWRVLLAAAAAVLLAVWPTASQAQLHTHGGGGGGGGSLTAEQSVPVCFMNVGPYRFNFVGYLPETAEDETFCGDVPGEGRVIIALDAVQKELRRMQVEFRVLSDAKNLGSGATYEKLGGQPEIDAATLFVKPMQPYPGGTVSVETTLKKGHYIGLVTLFDPEENKTFQTAFAFTAGIKLSSQNTTVLISTLLIGGILAGFAYFAFFRHQKPANSAA